MKFIQKKYFMFYFNFFFFCVYQSIILIFGVDSEGAKDLCRYEHFGHILYRLGASESIQYK